MEVTKKAGKKVLCPEGTHVAIVAQIIDYGMMPGQNGEWRMIEVMLETPEELHVFNEERGEEPFLVAQVVSDNLGGTKKRTKLRDMVEGIIGKAVTEESYDLETLLGMQCQIQVVHQVKGEYTNEVIKAFMPLPKTDKKKRNAVSPVLVIDLDNFDEEAFALLPEWKQDKIKKSPQYQELAKPAPKSTLKPQVKGASKKKELFN